MQRLEGIRSQRHKDLYRSTRNRIPHWKNRLRNEFMLGTRSARLKLLDKFRNCKSSEPSHCGLNGSAVDHHQLAITLMEEEWGDDGSLLHKLKYGSDEEQEALLTILEEVQAEMRTFSEQLVEDVARFEEADMAQLVGRCTQHEVICPVCQVCHLLCVSGVSSVVCVRCVICSVCQVNVLHQDTPMDSSFACLQTHVSCVCGLRLRAATLSSVQTNIESTLDLHSGQCPHPLSFAATSAPPGEDAAMLSSTESPASERLFMSNVLITCASCEWMSFLL
ncbi:hypothetical protein FHG87_019385 [Trinorchestia longiramus]|nr:hypothetical protein FHG87_019385 [Trinorchestia longiramus]